MTKTIAVLTTVIMLSGLVVSPVLAACGARPDCGDCVTEETCTGALLCSWDGVDTCSNQAISAVSESDITSLTANISGLFGDFLPLIMLVIGLPLGFWIIQKSIGLVIPKK